MRKYIFIMCLVGLVGCSSDFNFKEYGSNLRIAKKMEWSNGYSVYRLAGNSIDSRFSSYTDLILPNNFGEVGWTITVTNGIVAHKPE